ncbi:pyrroline-5-carboxylate reductase [Histomonas meleagridis]|uniref:pyrroline-5-carboxylate reductase n=1 Tax=Histomonas meleagridis TaxID=135588 RepID=UPI003559A8BE|nr:pyrroline-5-carboxylate reductase [Histomonas meleagridis]KAH0802319.1 pyrroline-5-carboxylate reductase [Histomonas meleagridis]
MVSDISKPQLNYLENKFHISAIPDNKKIAKMSDVLVLAVKPKDFTGVLSEIKNDVSSSKPVISIAGGLTISYIENQLCSGARVLRSMPNICSTVQESITAICCGKNSTPADVEATKSIFSCVGTTVDINESLFDAFSGVAGCGPAFIFPVIEALADGAVYEGINRKTAIELAAKMIIGSAKLVLNTSDHPEQLKDSVCSPGGSTIAGVKTLEEYKVRAAFMNAVINATEKSKEMGKQS